MAAGPSELHSEASPLPCVPSCSAAAFPECVQVRDACSTLCSPFSSTPLPHHHPGGCSSQPSFVGPQQRPSEGVTTTRGGDGRLAPGGLGKAATAAGAWRWRSFWGVLTSPPLSQVVSQLPVGPESGETLFLAEQPPLPPSLTNGTAVPAAKPLPTLIKVQTPSPLLPPPLCLANSLVGTVSAVGVLTLSSQSGTSRGHHRATGGLPARSADAGRVY